MDSILPITLPFSHETRFSDGEIYYKVRYYKDIQQDDLAQEWMLCLSKSKQRNLSWLLEYTAEELPEFERVTEQLPELDCITYTELLDKIVEFPGMRSGLQLGNIRRHFALRFDEGLLRYLCRIFETWSIITLNDPVLRRSAGIETVQRLEGRAPSASVADRRSIIKDMDLGILFPNISDVMTRQRIREAILDLNVIIPSIKTFHENCKILEIGVQIIRRELTNSREGSLFSSLYNIWSPLSGCWLETHEGIFQRVIPPENVDLAYLGFFIIFLAAIRQFPNLGHIAPRRNIRSIPLHADIVPAYQTLFARRARWLGFYNRQIQKTCNLIEGELSLTAYQSSTSRRSNDGIESRWGRPFGLAHAQLQRNLFIMNLSRGRIENSEASAMFVQQDFLRAFFRPSILFAEWVVESPHLPRPITTNLALNGNQQQENSTNQQIMETPLSIALETPPTQVRSNFNFARESAISPTTVTTSSWRSYISQTPSIIGTVRSSPRLQDLTLQFMNTEIETDVGERPTLAHNSLVVNEETEDNRASSTLVLTSFQNMREDSWNSRSNSTTVFNSDEGSWVSESSTIIASEENEPGDPTPTNLHHRSYLEPHQLRGSEPVADSIRHTSFQNPRWSEESVRRRGNAQVGNKQRLVGKRRTRSRRSFLTPRLRRTKHAYSHLRRGRTMQSLLGTYQDESDLIEDTNCPKGKGILRDSPEINNQSTRNTRSILVPRKRSFQVGESSKLPEHSTQELLQQDVIWGTMRSYAGSDHDHQDSEHLYPSSPKRVELQSAPSESQSPAINFIEYNGMKVLPRSTRDLSEYLKRRKGWIGMIVIDNESKSLRLDHIAKYINDKRSENNSQAFMLVKQSHAERFRINYPR